MSLPRTYQLMILCGTLLVVYYSTLFVPICRVDDAKLIFSDVADTKLSQILPLLFSNSGYYRPLLGATFILDNYFWMLEESFLHLDNVLLHLGNTVLLYAVTERLAKRVGIQPIAGIPFIVALLFALHPLATESVNWISGRTDPLACLFLLLSFKILLDWIEAPTTGRIIRMQLCFFLACLAKETAVFYIAPALLLLSFFLVKSAVLNDDKPSFPSVRSLLAKIRTNVLINASFVITTTAYFLLRFYSASLTQGGDRGMTKLVKYVSKEKAESLWFDKLMEVFRSIGFYSKKMFAPWPLNFNLVQVSDWYVLLGLVVVVLLTRFCWKRRDLVAVLLLSSFLVGSSALLVSVGHLAWTTYAERYLYIPLIFFIPATVLWLHEKLGDVRDGQLFRVIILILCGASLITTVQRNLVWMDSPTFYACNFRQAPDLPITIRNYAASLQIEGRREEAKSIYMLLPRKKKALQGTSLR